MVPWRRRTYTRGGGLLAAVMLTTTVTGCGLFGSGSAPGSSSGSGGSGAGSAGPVTLNADGTVPKPLTSLTRRFGDYDITIDIAALHRFDQATRLQFTITPRSRGTSTGLSSTFLGRDAGTADASGVYLLDTAGLKRYPVLHDAQNHCLCTRRPKVFELDTPTLVYADFPAVPADVKRITVVVPRLGMLPDTEIS